MKKIQLSNFFKRCYSVLKEYSPEILTGIGISGMVGSTVMAVKATPKALTLIKEEKKSKKTDELSVKDMAKATWKCYIPSGISIVLSSACIIGANRINTKRNTALATAYSLSESALKLYQEKVVETIGEKKEQEVRDKIAADKMIQSPASTQEIIVTDKGNTLCYDSLSDRYFKSDIESLRKAVNECNRQMIADMSISLNDFYDAIGLKGIKTGNSLGWNANRGFIELIFSTQLADNGNPCLVIDFREMPVYDYE
ncbi:MAG: DUF6353 family protein [Clostridia bacterium]|nr:DUF6353 family protein [Clostridia bacterium]